MNGFFAGFFFLISFFLKSLWANLSFSFSLSVFGEKKSVEKNLSAIKIENFLQEYEYMP